MKTYENVPLKRYIQRILWKHIPIQTKRILALSSPNFEWEYLRVLPGKCISDKNITFVNFEFSDDFYWSKTVENSLIGAFDVMVHENKPPFFIDADFCKSIKNCGDDLIYLYNKCKKLNRNIYISFTFSIRGVGLDNTLKWLKENFGINTNSPHYRSEVYFEDYPFKYREFAYVHGDCIHYRESGDQMITGVIVI